METTLEVRWFFRGLPPAVVQRWFRLECLGKSLETEVRTDLYALIAQERLNLLTEFLSHRLSCEQVNLKSRQGNLELKLRQQDFGTYRFSNSKQSRICEGRVEQWCKLSDRQLLNSVLPCNSPQEINWIDVNKEREQKIEQGVKSELTWLKCDRGSWWTVAFEMTQKKAEKQQDRRFQDVVEKACQTYSGPQLLVANSFGYSQWLLESMPQTMPQR
ncbi:hypothetical protein IQ255_29670 [Pleurocapsales cyanobacterium LEGE 10410]|nr:hypothetical protein [Pleurocapsales cyanobacterium LEGE 10410]